jgi:hypothetical protein
MPPRRLDYWPLESQDFPLSPVFECLVDLKQWLVRQGRSREFARALSIFGYAKSSPTNEGTGCFRSIDSFPYYSRLVVCFVIDGYEGEAYLSEQPSLEGLDGSRVSQLYI